MTLKSRIQPRESLAVQALDRVLDAIMQGEIEPGEMIKEAVVARQLGISRGPLREALSRLEGGQLVERLPGLGVRVIKLSKADLISLFEIRAALEGLACRLAATRLSESGLAELEDLVVAQSVWQNKKHNGNYSYATDDDFHLRIAHASQNDRLIKVLSKDLYFPVRLYRHRSARSSADRLKEAHLEHEKVVKALRARDPERAERAMRQHIENAMASLLIETEAALSALAEFDNVRQHRYS